MGIDLAGIRGTGPNGLILREDILKAHEAAQETGKTMPLEEKEMVPVQSDGIIPFTRVGKVVAGNMTKSKTTIPHVYFRIDVDAAAMMPYGLLPVKRFLIMQCCCIVWLIP
ncbi:MAG: E3 binding domain-containing protein [Clostridia bacterium]